MSEIDDLLANLTIKEKTPEKSKLKPIIIENFANLREERQKFNNLLASESIKARDLTKNINIKAFERVVSLSNKSKDDILDKCANDQDYCMLLSMIIAINASRQGTSDEALQINICNSTSSKCGITLSNLTTTDFRPTKTGKIITKKEQKEKKILKSDCLKSFDAKISGKINGWVFAKVVFGSGGHQDNVFEEAHTFCDWVVKFGKKTEIYIILCDTDLTLKFNELQEKYKNIDNIIIGNHVKIQQYFIDNYS